jgi:hypothetical protein
MLSRHPTANLMSIANADGNVGHPFAKKKFLLLLQLKGWKMLQRWTSK